MNIYIDNTLLKIDYFDNDDIQIKSFNKNYHVHFTNKNIYNILDNIISDNDFIFIDENIYNIYAKEIKKNPILLFNASEENKTIENVLVFIDKLIDYKFTKKNKIIVIGGGITQDVGGFVSTIFKRGVQWIFIPTTLLSMTDSAIGGKVCINRNNKNILSLFNAPNNIYISDIFLKSLKEDEIISGIGESLKLSLIGGEHSYNLFKQYYYDKKYIQIIKLSLSIKKTIIEFDEFEKHERKILNYGHTFGHAIESVTNYFVPHGIAVLFGMYIVNNIFYPNKYNDIQQFILELIPNKFKHINIHYDLLIEYILNDKKNDGEKICFIEMYNIGHMKINYYNYNDISHNIKNTLNNIFFII